MWQNALTFVGYATLTGVTILFGAVILSLAMR